MNVHYDEIYLQYVYYNLLVHIPLTYYLSYELATVLYTHCPQRIEGRRNRFSSLKFLANRAQMQKVLGVIRQSRPPVTHTRSIVRCFLLWQANGEQWAASITMCFIESGHQNHLVTNTTMLVQVVPNNSLFKETVTGHPCHLCIITWRSLSVVKINKYRLFFLYVEPRNITYAPVFRVEMPKNAQI